LLVASELFDGARDACFEVENFGSGRGERDACRLVAPAALLGLAGWVGWSPPPASDMRSARRQLSSSRMSRSLRAKASGWPADRLAAELGSRGRDAGLLDKILIHRVPVLLGDGVRLYGLMGPPSRSTWS
jgi:hypothetical protein